MGWMEEQLAVMSVYGVGRSCCWCCCGGCMQVAVINPSMATVSGKSTELSGAVTSVALSPDGRGFLAGTNLSNRSATARRHRDGEGVDHRMLLVEQELQLSVWPPCLPPHAA